MEPRAFLSLPLALLAAAVVSAQSDPAPPGPPAARPTAPPAKAAPPPDVAALFAHDCAELLAMQEGEGRREWPYEGVYRTNENGRRRVIPIGYRVGGTAIAGLALIEAPGLDAESGDERRAAIERALEFVLASIEDPLMQPWTEDVYDVRGWGHVYALTWLLRMRELDAVPAGREEDVERALAWFVDALEHGEIRPSGGWNYANHHAASPFMTAPAVLALLAAREQGFDVDGDCIDRALSALERGRAMSGSYAYTAPPSSRAEVDEPELAFMDKLPGAIGRMVAVETALTAAGRGDRDRLSAAVAAFFEHQEQLEVRRKQNGTHIRPYGVAPYYFMYAHYYAARAIALLEGTEREEAGDRLREILFAIREPEGGWNDRVFPRSRNFGTAMGLLALVTLGDGADLAERQAPSKGGAPETDAATKDRGPR
jgi:hypothetical protein